jgi:hypothetical protein
VNVSDRPISLTTWLDRDGTRKAAVKRLWRLGGHVWLMLHIPAYRPILARGATV